MFLSVKCQQCKWNLSLFRKFACLSLPKLTRCKRFWFHLTKCAKPGDSIEMHWNTVVTRLWCFEGKPWDVVESSGKICKWTWRSNQSDLFEVNWFFKKLNCKTSRRLVRLEMQMRPQILPCFTTLFSRCPTLKVGQHEKSFSSLVSDSCSSGTVPRIHFYISDLTSAKPSFVYIPKVARYGCDW